MPAGLSTISLTFSRPCGRGRYSRCVSTSESYRSLARCPALVAASARVPGGAFEGKFLSGEVVERVPTGRPHALIGRRR